MDKIRPSGRLKTKGRGAFSSDRRTSTRYPAAETRSRLGWWDGAEFRDEPAVLLNISMRGALLAADAEPSPGQGLWFRLDGETPSAWAEAAVVKAVPSKAGPCTIALKFRALCSYEIFKVAAFGPGILADRPQPAPDGDDEETRDYW